MKRTLCILLAATSVLLFAACNNAVTGTKTTPSGMTVKFLTTGKSDCIIIKTGDTVILNDVADEDDYNVISEALNDMGINKIDYFIISHFDNDHIGSAPMILQNYAVSVVYAPDYIENSKEYRSLISALNARTSVEFKKLTEDVTFDIDNKNGSIDIDIPEQKLYADVNDYSLITTVKYGKTSILLTGDAMKDRMNEFFKNSFEKYDLVKLPHHGSCFEKLKLLIARCDAKNYVVCTSDISTVENDLMTAVSGSSGKLYYTYNGVITATSDGNTLTLVQK